MDQKEKINKRHSVVVVVVVVFFFLNRIFEKYEGQLFGARVLLSSGFPHLSTFAMRNEVKVSQSAQHLEIPVRPGGRKRGRVGGTPADMRARRLRIGIIPHPCRRVPVAGATAATAGSSAAASAHEGQRLPPRRPSAFHPYGPRPSSGHRRPDVGGGRSSRRPASPG